MKKISMVQLGVGGVGRALVRQIRANRERHADQLGLSLQYTAIADRDGAVMNNEGLPTEQLTKLIEAKAKGARLRDLADGQTWDGGASLLDACESSNAIVVDVSASEATVPILREARGRGFGIVLANKLPLAGPYEIFRELTSSRRTRFETTVGAALPVISTLQSFLLDTGDAVRRIRGCVSGTLNMICQRLEKAEKLSQIVRDAKAHGHTEPDPREDLGGRDAARKALILARMMGCPLEFKDVEIEPLYPSEMDALSVDEFMKRLSEHDRHFVELAGQAKARSRKLRYVIEVAEDHCRARLEQLSLDDELLRPGVADSVLAFETARYRDSALIIRGQGSGPELTASGVLADILLLAQSTH
jgi:homoserine dehydrogenase